MVELSFIKGKIIEFEGDGILCPCDVYLCDKRANNITLDLFAKAGPGLTAELSAIGFGELGQAAITQGYNLGVGHIIFLPCKDSNNKRNKLNFILLHQAFKAVFTLVHLYGIETLAVALPDNKEALDVLKVTAKESKCGLKKIVVFDDK